MTLGSRIPPVARSGPQIWIDSLSVHAVRDHSFYLWISAIVAFAFSFPPFSSLRSSKVSFDRYRPYLLEILQLKQFDALEQRIGVLVQNCENLNY